MICLMEAAASYGEDAGGAAEASGGPNDPNGGGC